MTEPDDAEYRICRECADSGASTLGNDGWYRHRDCASSVNSHPHKMRQTRLAGCRVIPYQGGDVAVVRGAVHSVTSRLTVTGLAQRYGERGVDFDRLTPTDGHPCEEVPSDD